MNRVALLIAIAYVSLALVSVGVYVVSTVKLVEYSDTQLRFSSPAHTFVSYADVSPSGGDWAIVVRWRFENHGRLPIVIANFQFLMGVDNRSGELCNSPPVEGEEFARYGSFNSDRFTGPTVAPAGSLVKTWMFWANGTEASLVAQDPSDGRFYLVFSDIRVVYYIADVDARHRNDFGPRCLAV